MEKGGAEGKETVLVTGGAGFVGSYLCERLVKDGYKVISLDNYFTGSKENHIEGAEYREGHTKNIEKHIPETPDIIYHLGEYSRVEQSLLEPEVVKDLNTVGTQRVVEFWKKHKCKLVYAGSSTKFGDGGKARDVTPYAKTKAENTELVKEVGDSESLPYAITYFYNVYGPRERSGMYGTVIGAFRQMYLKGTPITVTAPGTQRRNFTHVDDIVDGLMLVGQKGEGDEFGLGNEQSFAMIEVAKMFGENIMMLPSRAGNRMGSDLDATKIKALGWNPKRTLREYVDEFIATHTRGANLEKRILVFSTTFYPTIGPAEEALIKLMKEMPDVYFDVVTTTYDKEAINAPPLAENIAVHRVGWGTSFDKFLLPILGSQKARALKKEHSYLFSWSLMASYATLTALLARRSIKLPILVTLADQQITWYSKLFLSLVLRRADQVYASLNKHEKYISKKVKKYSTGEGNAFANQIRQTYAEILLN